jgi:hypothetical protein
MDTISLILSILAINTVLFPRVSEAWTKHDSAFIAVGGFVIHISSVFIILALIISHISIT